MSKRDDFSDLGFEESSDFSDLGFEPEIQEEEPVSTLEAIGKGVARGGTLGFADELSGGIQAIGSRFTQPSEEDVLSALSPEVREKVKAQGLDVSVPQESLLQEYEKARNLYRQQEEKAFEDRPIAANLSMLAGGVIPVAPSALGTGLIGMARAGALAGGLAGAGEAEELSDVPKEAIEGAGIGATGAAVLGGGAKLLQELNPEWIKSPFNVGRKGLSDATPSGKQASAQLKGEFLDTLSAPATQKLSQADELLQQRNLLVEDTKNLAKELKGVKGQKKVVSKSLEDNINKSIDDLKSSIQKQQDEQKALLLGQNKEDIKKSAQTLKTLQENIKKKLNSSKTQIKQEFDNLDKIADELQIQGNNENAIASFMEGLADVPGTEKTVEKIFKYRNKNDYASYRQLKNELYKLGQSDNLAVKKAANRANAQLRDDLIEGLVNSPDQSKIDFAERMLQNNKKFRSILDIEDNFIPDISPNPITKKTYADAKTQSTLETLVTEDQAAKLGQTEKFEDLLKILGGDVAPEAIKKEVAAPLHIAKELEAFKPQLDDVDDILSKNPEFLAQQEKLSKVKLGQTEELAPLVSKEEELVKSLEELKNKGNKLKTEASKIKGSVSDEFRSTNPAAIRDRIESLVNRLDGPEKLDEMLKNYSPSQQKQIREQFETLRDVRKTRSFKERGGYFTPIATKSAEAVGRAAKTPVDLYKATDDLVKNQTADYENILREFGTVGEYFANMVNRSAKGANANATTFNLMQNPALRNINRKILNQEEADDESVK